MFDFVACLWLQYRRCEGMLFEEKSARLSSQTLEKKIWVLEWVERQERQLQRLWHEDKWGERFLHEGVVKTDIFFKYNYRTKFELESVGKKKIEI